MLEAQTEVVVVGGTTVRGLKEETHRDGQGEEKKIRVVSNLIPGGPGPYWSRVDCCGRFWDKGLLQCKTPRLFLYLKPLG